MPMMQLASRKRKLKRKTKKYLKILLGKMKNLPRSNRNHKKFRMKLCRLKRKPRNSIKKKKRLNKMLKKLSNFLKKKKEKNMILNCMLMNWKKRNNIHCNNSIN